MRVGILSLNYGYHGEATAAATWTKHLCDQGHEAELFTFSKSGKKLKKMRRDYEFVCLKSRDVDVCLQYLDKFDVVISFGLGEIGEEYLDIPHYFEPLSKMNTPLVIYFPIADHCEDTYKNSRFYLKLPTVVGTLFLRESIRDYVYSSYPFKEIVENRQLPNHVVKHPHYMGNIHPTPKLYNVVLSTARIASSKKIKNILRAYKEYNEKFNGYELLVWGDKGSSRYGYLLEQEFGELFNILWQGSYTHSELDKVYDRGKFCIDLTNFVGDGGVQNTFLEAVKRSTLPILSKGWNVSNSCIEVETPSCPLSVAEAVEKATSMPEAERLDRLRTAQNYICEHHDPSDQVSSLVNWLTGVIS